MRQQLQDEQQTGSHIATAIPVQQATRAFQPASVEMAQNAYSGAGLGFSDSTASVLEPYQLSMKKSLQAGEGAVQQ